MLTVSRLARRFGLSRSTLLYYDRIGLLPPSGRSLAGYRCYTEADADRLNRICTFRNAGLALSEIKVMLTGADGPSKTVLENRLAQLSGEIRDLRIQQQLLCAMLRRLSGESAAPRAVNKEMWVQMLQAAGMDERAMEQWHSEFECRAPEAHHEFLLSLGMAEPEIGLIRQWAARKRAEQSEQD
jgi:MerR family transcriptional regulator, thiopeptide resistance regulator